MPGPRHRWKHPKAFESYSCGLLDGHKYRVHVVASLSQRGASSSSSFMTTTSPSVVDLDDGDNHIVFTGAWVHQVGDPPNPLAFDNTLTYTEEVGATASFTFVGTSVSIIGALGPIGTCCESSTYAIDGGTPGSYVNTTTTEFTGYGVQYYTSPSLQEGQHTLLITNFGDVLWLHYLRVSVSSPMSASSPASGPSSVSVSSPLLVLRLPLPAVAPQPSIHRRQALRLAARCILPPHRLHRLRRSCRRRCRSPGSRQNKLPPPCSPLEPPRCHLLGQHQAPATPAYP
ncbi:hypothetical protein OBBRIDRAFT_204369 [Obba rivulosa]|uniref:Uncharacterized protein n=1 Tax=Obba rivulosa TaxID=1052685 RepID=A0A8E2ARF9_9APHY|nr:hypothetical protein OBBRIDRAFT_204369 [Obba rivulosa]